eukprot:Nitzschia sp. Nitz4//scaffold48_size128905//64303//66480//NITZ4_003599-RA/size128905-augustus-gene-0.23-mRNA-1//-1//CDS//3329552979//810//frame0
MASPELTNTAIESALATLQPIRDLSRNWDIDIASCLQDYLREIVGDACGSLDHTDGVQVPEGNLQEVAPNFARAALILHNSSHVYSRKVEYLHSLVYKALYEFFSKTNTGQSKEARKSVDAAIDEFYDFDPHEDFLLLDDVVPEDWTQQKINLKEEDSQGQASLPASMTPNNRSLTRTRLSLGGASMTRGDVSQGEFGLAAHQRTLVRALTNGSLRLVDGHCDVGECGALLIPGSLPNQPASCSSPNNHNTESERRNLFGDETGDAMNVDHTLLESDDHSNDGPGFYMHNDDDNSVAPPTDVEVTVGHFPASQPAKRVTFDEQQHVEAKPRDPWALLDPHSGEGFQQKPLRRGKTYRLPDGIKNPPSECVTGARTSRHHQIQPLVSRQETRTGFAVGTLHALLGKRRDPPKVPLNGLLFGNEFAYIAKINSKRRAQFNHNKRNETRQGQVWQIADDFDDGIDDDYGGGAAWDDDDVDDNDMGNAGYSSLDQAFQNAEIESNLGKTFEELCRAHIQSFAKGAEDFALKTQLTERVSRWQAKLAPILEEEERRSEFDIFKYSERVIDVAQDKIQTQKRNSDGFSKPTTPTVGFATVATGCTQSDVCRLFLASLSLANAGNLKIDEEAPIFQFDIVSGTLDRPMQSYVAPSMLHSQ